MSSSSVISGSSTRSSSSSTLMMRMNPLAGPKAKREIEQRRGDVKTYTVPVMFAGDVDRKGFYQSYHKKYNNSKKTSIYRLQVLRKHPTTVAKFYHELVEHSGKVTPEEFWQRYDYRCCDVGRVMGELQAVKEAGKRRRSQQQRLKPRKSKKQPAYVQTYKDEAKKTATMSWMSVKSSATSSVKSSKTKSTPGGVETAGTVDTADEEAYAHEEVDHVQAFKRSIGGDVGGVVDAPTVDTAKTLDEESLDGDNTGVASIFRGTKANAEASSEKSSEQKASVSDAAPPLKLVGLWLLFALLACLVVEPQRWMTRAFGNKLCAPIRPGTMVDTSQGAETYVAPWWAPSVAKSSMFSQLCSVDSQGELRPRTKLVADVWPNRLRNRNRKHLSVKVVALDDDNGSEKVLVKVPRVSSFEVDGSKLLVEHLNGHKDYDAPWALP